MKKTCFHANVKSDFKKPNRKEEYRKSGVRVGCLYCSPPGDCHIKGFVNKIPAASIDPANRLVKPGPLHSGMNRALLKVAFLLRWTVSVLDQCPPQKEGPVSLLGVGQVEGLGEILPGTWGDGASPSRH